MSTPWPSCKNSVQFSNASNRLVELSVCDVVVLSPSGCMDQHETWHADRPRPRPHCVRWGTSSPTQRVGGAGSPQISAHICSAQIAGWIKMPLGTEVRLGPGDIVLGGDPAPLPKKKRGRSPPIFGPFIVAKRLDGSRCHLVRR